MSLITSRGKERGPFRKGFRHYGKDFRDCVVKVKKVFGVEVKRAYGYEVEYRCVWECVACGKEYKRRSKSVNVERYDCSCSGDLVRTKPPPRRMSEYNRFVQEQYGPIKAKNPGLEFGEIIGILAKTYREHKASRKVMNDAMREDLVSPTKPMEDVTLVNEYERCDQR